MGERHTQAWQGGSLRNEYPAFIPLPPSSILPVLPSGQNQFRGQENIVDAIHTQSTLGSVQDPRAVWGRRGANTEKQMEKATQFKRPRGGAAKTIVRLFRPELGLGRGTQAPRMQNLSRRLLSGSGKCSELSRPGDKTTCVLWAIESRNYHLICKHKKNILL